MTEPAELEPFTVAKRPRERRELQSYLARIHQNWIPIPRGKTRHQYTIRWLFWTMTLVSAFSVLAYYLGRLR